MVSCNGVNGDLLFMKPLQSANYMTKSLEPVGHALNQVPGKQDGVDFMVYCICYRSPPGFGRGQPRKIYSMRL